MKALIQKIVNFYNTNALFHSFVLALEYAVASFVTTSLSSGTLPMNKQAWIAFFVGLGGAVVAAAKRWLATNLATKNLQMKQQ